MIARVRMLQSEMRVTLETIAEMIAQADAAPAHVTAWSEAIDQYVDEGRAFHRAQAATFHAVETAHATAPAIDPDAEAWLRRQLATLTDDEA